MQPGVRADGSRRAECEGQRGRFQPDQGWPHPRSEDGRGLLGRTVAKDLNRKSGVKRVPARYFGLVEGQFVFLCYFQTPDNAGFVKGCSEDFDEKLTPLCAKLAQAVKDAGHKILIMAKAVADDGPDEKKLNVFFPDMHLPRKFDEKDPEYATADCIFRVQMVKSMVLHQLKRDYRLPAEQTPWLAVQDRQLCRDFFEHGAEKLKLPHWNTGRRFSNPFDPAGSDVVSAAADAVKKAYQALMQVGYYMFEFTQDDYRRMVRKYNEEFPEKGYGRTWDVLFNWFYGFETDKNKPPPQKSGVGEEAKSMIPAIVSDVADTNFGTKLGPDAGTKPATESYDRVDAAPARDLLRFLKVMSEQRRKAGLQIQVFQTGDLCEMWANRRYLFEDFEETDDPGGQMPSVAKSLTPSDSSSSGGGALAAVGSALKTYGLPIVRTFLQIMLGGINAGEHNLWFRRECNEPAASDDPEHPEQDRLPPEESWNVNSIDDDFMLPQFTGPGRSPGGVGLATSPTHPLKTPSVNYTNVKLNDLKKSKERRKGYLTAEAQRRLGQIADFEAPFRRTPAASAKTRSCSAAISAARTKTRASGTARCWRSSPSWARSSFTAITMTTAACRAAAAWPRPYLSTRSRACGPSTPIASRTATSTGSRSAHSLPASRTTSRNWRSGKACSTNTRCTASRATFSQASCSGSCSPSLAWTRWTISKSRPRTCRRSAGSASS